MEDCLWQQIEVLKTANIRNDSWRVMIKGNIVPFFVVHMSSHWRILEECCPTRNEERGKKSVFLPAEV
jgi:hypothetical protein